MIEASGVADPANVAAYGQGWPGCRLDAVVVLADAETVQAKSRDQFVGELVVRQLRRADIVMATKCDLVTEAERSAVVGWLAETAPGAPILTRHTGRLEPELLLETAQSIDRSPRQQPHAGNGPAEPAFDSAVIEVDAALDRDRVEAALRDWPDSVLRVKGTLRFDGTAGGLHVVHRVGRRWSIEPAPASLDSTLTGKLVVIGLPGTLRHRDLTASLLS